MIQASQVVTRIRVRVDAATTAEQAVALRERLTETYEKAMDDLADDDVYSALNKLLEQCDIGGDFHIDRPDFEVWIGDKQVA